MTGDRGLLGAVPRLDRGVALWTDTGDLVGPRERSRLSVPGLRWTVAGEISKAQESSPWRGVGFCSSVLQPQELAEP